MTTTVKVHVNGQYRASVKQDDRDPVVVEGNYNGGSGEASFHLPHPANSTFVVTEEYVKDEDKKEAVVPDASVYIGMQVRYFDPTGMERKALVTNAFGVTNPSINVVYVNYDAKQTDSYGQKLERATSVPHRKHQQAHGNYWLP